MKLNIVGIFLGVFECMYIVEMDNEQKNFCKHFMECITSVNIRF